MVELKVLDVFRFQDGRTVFVGPVQSETKYISRSQADLVVDGHVVAIVELEGEMIPNGRHPLGYRSVSTIDAVDFQSISPTEAEVSLRIHPST